MQFFINARGVEPVARTRKLATGPGVRGGQFPRPKPEVKGKSAIRGFHVVILVVIFLVGHRVGVYLSETLRSYF